MATEVSKVETVGKGGRPKGTPKTGGRAAGTPNKTTTLLKDAILKAAEKAGGKDGIVGYLETQAAENPGPFMTLLGKVLPTQVNMDGKLELSPTINVQTNSG